MRKSVDILQIFVLLSFVGWVGGFLMQGCGRISGAVSTAQCPRHHSLSIPSRFPPRYHPRLQANKYSINIDPLRFVSYNLLAVALALGANFLGVTSDLMTKTDPTFFRAKQLDQLYPIDGYRRVVDRDDGYQFIFPTDWVLDQRVLMYNTRSKELPQSSLRQQRLDNGLAPDVAYGPAGGDFMENISVVKSRVLEGFSLRETLGSAADAAEKILRTIIAPQGSGRKAQLLRAEEVKHGTGDTDGGSGQGQSSSVYEIEYTLEIPSSTASTRASPRSNDADPTTFPMLSDATAISGGTSTRHVLSVIAHRPSTNTLFTFTATIPADQWQQEDGKLRTAAHSFEVDY